MFNLSIKIRFMAVDRALMEKILHGTFPDPESSDMQTMTSKSYFQIHTLLI